MLLILKLLPVKIIVPMMSATEKTDIYFDPEPFAEGRFRYAYKGTWAKPPGKKCVVKKFKDSYTWEITAWDTTLKLHSRAQDLAKAFGRGLEFNSCSLGQIIGCTNAPREPRLNEFVVQEDYLEGDFNKWCSNYGYVSREARGVDYTLPSFMHWSWVYSKGQEMIGDLQGVKTTERGYRLTDPAIMSTSGQYGVTDTRIEGMAMFFLIHECSDICRGLPKPTLAQFVSKIPDSMIKAALALQQLSARGTTYNPETKFSDQVKQLLIPIFSAIAQGRNVF